MFKIGDKIRSKKPYFGEAYYRIEAKDKYNYYQTTNMCSGGDWDAHKEELNDCRKVLWYKKLFIKFTNLIW